jgi:hypothetical protein
MLKHASFDPDFHSRALSVPPADHLHPGNGADGREGLSPEAEGAEGEEILRGLDLAGGIALHRQEGFFRGHSLPVIGHPDQLPPSGLDFHFDRTASCVQGVLQQLFHHRGRSFHDFAGGDLGDEFRRKGFNFAHHLSASGQIRS